MQHGNVQVGHIIHSNIWNVNIKYLTITDHTKGHMKIHTIKKTYHCLLCAKKSISRSNMKSHGRENLNPYALCGREVISKNNSKTRSKRNIE